MKRQLGLLGLDDGEGEDVKESIKVNKESIKVNGESLKVNEEEKMK